MPAFLSGFQTSTPLENKSFTKKQSACQEPIKTIFHCADKMKPRLTGREPIFATIIIYLIQVLIKHKASVKIGARFLKYFHGKISKALLNPFLWKDEPFMYLMYTCFGPQGPKESGAMYPDRVGAVKVVHHFVIYGASKKKTGARKFLQKIYNSRRSVETHRA